MQHLRNNSCYSGRTSVPDSSTFKYSSKFQFKTVEKVIFLQLWSLQRIPEFTSLSCVKFSCFSNFPLIPTWIMTILYSQCKNTLKNLSQWQIKYNQHSFSNGGPQKDVINNRESYHICTNFKFYFSCWWNTQPLLKRQHLQSCNKHILYSITPQIWEKNK